MLYKHIHIGERIRDRVVEQEIPVERICNFLNCEEDLVEQMYQNESIDSILLLKWSKLLEYDFFRLYSAHLILYSPPAGAGSKVKTTSKLPQFRKSIYTKEIKDFIIKRIRSKEMSMSEVINQYGIPKTTLHKWLKKQE